MLSSKMKGKKTVEWYLQCAKENKSSKIFLHCKTIKNKYKKRHRQKRKLNAKKKFSFKEKYKEYKFNPRGKIKLTEETRQKEGTK